MVQAIVQKHYSTFATSWPRKLEDVIYKSSEGQNGSERLRYFDEQLEIRTLPGVHAPSCYREAWSCSWKMLAPWSNSTSPLVCLSSHAALQMKVDSQPFSSVLGAGAFGSPTLFHWSLLCRGSSCSLCCTGIRKMHKDVAWKAPSAVARPQHELQMASFFYNAVKVPILQSFCVSHGLSSSRLHTCLQCLLKGVGYTVNTHTHNFCCSLATIPQVPGR